jgi:hypothetical protein
MNKFNILGFKLICICCVCTSWCWIDATAEDIVWSTRGYILDLFGDGIPIMYLRLLQDLDNQWNLN